MFGSALSSQRGMYQVFSPSSVMKAGMSVIFTTSASVRIATASSSPNSFEMRSGVTMKAEKTVAMITAAATMTRPIAAIGRVIVAAAIIMATVFSAFILTPDRISKEFGLLLAVAILTDALVVKMTLIPAFMTLMGEKSWYIPRWLDRILPNITIEPPTERPPAVAPTARPAIES